MRSSILPSVIRTLLIKNSFVNFFAKYIRSTIYWPILWSLLFLQCYSPTTLTTNVANPTTSLMPRITTDTSFGIVGTEDFYQMILDGEFVDKTLLIRDYLRSSETVRVVTRPRRFGKTVNLSMLRRFLEIELDEEGMPVPDEDKINPKLFVGGTVFSTEYQMNMTVKPLKISLYDDCLKHQGQYPVIAINLENVEPDNFDHLANRIRKYVANLFARYRYLRRTLSQKDRLSFDLFAGDGKIDVEQLSGSLRFLTDKISAHFGKKVHILIDEYDFPIRYVLIGHADRQPRDKYTLKMLSVLASNEFKKAVTLFKRVLSNLLLDNPALEKAFVTGVLPLIETDLSLELSRIPQYTVLDEPFVDFYGFTADEVEQLLTKSSKSDEYRSEIERWYKGYNFANGTKMVYNPWSVMCYLQQAGRWKDHWIHTGYMDLCEYWLMQNETQNTIRRLLSGADTVDVNIPESKMSLSDLVDGQLFGYLLFTGYLSPAVSKEDCHRRSNDNTVVRLIVPNYEIRLEFVQQVLNWVVVKFNVTVEDDLNEGKSLLIDGKVNEFDDWVRKRFCRKDELGVNGTTLTGEKRPQ